MKKSSLLLLGGTYSFIFLFTIFMQQIGMADAGMRVVVNISTLVMAGIGGGLFWLFCKKEEKNSAEKEKLPPLPAKEVYLKFAQHYRLTKRETELGYYLLNGYSNQKISEELYISETTVKKHITHIYEKAGAGGRKEFRQAFVHFAK